ncbi:hypothetical protein PFISCL1PPCAC_12232 [Pristionchus fissidentatus]|uniref:RING-type domain-containing protein n=1 Tax=Pristionchus fissidentatus TaxID=1538716 RepID=A0AAV5VQJ5_9BILA|nr:hypothetical protein PFISCL1PPCAC_12232 [Pristionchus fissidentatus]
MVRPACFTSCVITATTCRSGLTKLCDACDNWDEEQPLVCRIYGAQSPKRWLAARPHVPACDCHPCINHYGQDRCIILAATVMEVRRESGQPMLLQLKKPGCYKSCTEAFLAGASPLCTDCWNWRILLSVTKTLAGFRGSWEELAKLANRPPESGIYDSRRVEYIRRCAVCGTYGPERLAAFLHCGHTVCEDCMNRNTADLSVHRQINCGYGLAIRLREETSADGRPSRWCVICYDENPRTQRAIFLCGHSACTGCILSPAGAEEKIAEKKEKKCPICRFEGPLVCLNEETRPVVTCWDVMIVPSLQPPVLVTAQSMPLHTHNTRLQQARLIVSTLLENELTTRYVTFSEGLDYGLLRDLTVRIIVHFVSITLNEMVLGTTVIRTVLQATDDQLIGHESDVMSFLARARIVLNSLNHLKARAIRIREFMLQEIRQSGSVGRSDDLLSRFHVFRRLAVRQRGIQRRLNEKAAAFGF